MDEQRAELVRRYVVFHLKDMEVLHLILPSLHLLETDGHVGNEMGHSTDRFRETLLGTTVTAFLALSDNPKRSTNSRWIWKQLYPKVANAIDRIWESYIEPGEVIMKAYRDQSGAHGDRLDKYLDGKLGLFRDNKKVLVALQTYYGISICLHRRQAKEQPDLSADIEAVLLDAELARPREGGFNRRWLREMRLIESGSYKRTFR